MEKYNEKERKTMIACMEFIMRNVNDEEILFNSWLSVGVADGDIDYSKLVSEFTEEKESVDDYYIEDENFSEIMGVFLRCMSRANKSGGLYCNNVVSR